METRKKLKKEIRELNAIILLHRTLLFFYKKTIIQILGLLIAGAWSIVSYKWTGTLIAAPFVFAGMFIFVRFFWIPALTNTKDINEMETDLIKYRKEREEILISLNK